MDETGSKAIMKIVTLSKWRRLRLWYESFFVSDSSLTRNGPRDARIAKKIGNGNEKQRDEP